MRYFNWHNRNYTRFIIQALSIVNTFSAASNNLMSLKLSFVNMVLNAFVWCNSYKVITKIASSIFCCDDVLKLNTFKSRMFVPADFIEINLSFWQTQATIIKFFKKFFTHIVTSC